MSRTRRLTEAERTEIVRTAADGAPTSALAARFGVTPRTIQSTLRRDEERRRDTHVRTAGVSVTLTLAEVEAFDAVLAEAGIATRAEGLRRLVQAAGGTFVPDARLAAEMARYRSALHEVGNGVVLLARRMSRAGRSGQGAGQGGGVEIPGLQLAQVRALARFILDAADEIDLLLRHRRDAMQLEATAELREFVHAAE